MSSKGIFSQNCILSTIEVKVGQQLPSGHITKPWKRTQIELHEIKVFCKIKIMREYPFGTFEVPFPLMELSNLFDTTLSPTE